MRLAYKFKQGDAVKIKDPLWWGKILHTNGCMAFIQPDSSTSGVIKAAEWHHFTNLELENA